MFVFDVVLQACFVTRGESSHGKKEAKGKEKEKKATHISEMQIRDTEKRALTLLLLLFVFPPFTSWTLFFA